MRITTWNVNGIRAAIEKGLFSWVEEQTPDVFCLQEVKARPEQLDESLRTFPGYQSFWNPAQRPGYSGVASFLRIPYEDISYSIQEERFDHEGRVICITFTDFILYNIYFPNGQRGNERLQYKLDFYARLLEICDDLHAKGKKIIITGDFNTAHTEIDLANPKENANNSGFMPIEREWITRYLEHGFKDAFRVLYPEKIQYTWWTYRFGARRRNIGWRLDYYLVSDGLMEKIEDIVIHDDIQGSDHCPVSLYLR